MLARISRLTPLRPLVRSFKSNDSGPLEETEKDFLPPDAFYRLLTERGFDFFTGIPDSLLKDFTGYIEDNHPHNKHIISANEGTALATASGYYLATRKFPVVYMQNAGLGNIINPLLSLNDARVYKIPVLMIMGWRGEPGKKDEPQHLVQGKIMSGLLTDLGVTYEVLPDFEEGAAAALDVALHHLNNRAAPYAFLVRRATFTKYEPNERPSKPEQLLREQAIDTIINMIGKYDPVVCTSGFNSRELYSLRQKQSQDSPQDFYSLGARGHASSIAMGVAIAKPSKKVFCFDGDGSFLMHMGSAAQIGTRPLVNFRHIVFNNAVHESAGGAPTVANKIDFPSLAKACGYKYAASASTEEELKTNMQELLHAEGPSFLEVKVRRFTRNDLKNVPISPLDNKTNFMNFLDR